MEKNEIIKSIGSRTNGDIYLGVVGAVRTGKSTFIKKFIETLVLPNIEDEYEKKRCLDEMPQSAQGKTIMTTEPKFVPSNAAKINIEDFSCNIRLVDCVGYVIKAAKGYEDENELKEIGKPFIVLLNTTHPMLPETERLASSIKDKYKVPVMPISIETMTEKDSYNILKEALYEFPVVDIKVNMPEWIACLNHDHWLKKIYIEAIRECVVEVDKLRDVETVNAHFTTNEYIEKAYLSDVDATTGSITINLEAKENLYNEILNEIIGVDINSKADMINLFQNLKEAQTEYENIKGALKMVKQTGYGVAIPSINDLKLENPEVLKHGNRYGIKLKAVAPSIHMIRVDVESTFEPIIGSEQQSKELVNYIMKDADTDPESIWKSEIFGRSLDNIIQEGIQAKVAMMPENIRYKLQGTLTKVVNKGGNNMIAIVI